MSRRTHVRFDVLQSPEGLLRVLQDVVIQNSQSDHTIALSREPGVVGQHVSVQFPDGDDADIWAKVFASQPVVVGGSVRHQLRLRHLGAETLRTQRDDSTEGSVGQ